MRHYQPSAKSHGQAGSDRMGHVPDAHLGGQLARVYPLGQSLCARRYAHSLQEAVDEPENAHYVHQHGSDCYPGACLSGQCDHPSGYDIASPEENVHECAEHQAERHHLSGAVAVGYYSYHKPGQAIDDPVKGKEYSKFSLCDSEIGLKTWHRK